MGQVTIRLFGMRGGDSQLKVMERPLVEEMNVGELLNRLRAEADPSERLASVSTEALLVLVNGTPIEYRQGWQTQLADGDEVTYMVKTAGG